jgi:hypothetical protein
MYLKKTFRNISQNTLTDGLCFKKNIDKVKKDPDLLRFIKFQHQ